MGLASVTLLKMGIRITIVIVITAYVSYLHIISNLESQTLDKLEKYIIERSLKESIIFQLAQDNHKVFKDEFLTIWPKRKDAPSQNRFDKLFFHPGDGTVRLKKEIFEGIERDYDDPSSYLGISHSISGFVGRGAPIDDNSFKNRLLLTYDLVDRYAQAWSNRFVNTYVSMPEGVNIVYWPGLPWALGADSDLDIPAEEWVYIANKKNNPSRKSAWTGLYYDQTADEWMVSCETPVDDKNGQHLITVGHDILLNKLFDRVFNDHLEGAYNFIFRHDGRLIAHPKYVKELQAAKGVLNIKDMSSQILKDHYNSIINTFNAKDEKSQIIDEKGNKHDAFIAVSKIKGPNWYFVTVYPKQLLSTPATNAAKFIFYIGAIGLIIELIMLYLVLNSSVLKPLKQFLRASKEVGKGCYDIRANSDIKLPHTRTDEIGLLAKTFLLMGDRIHDYNVNLEDKIKFRTKELENAKNRAEKLARIDSLSGLSNRRAFFEFCNYEIEKSKRHGHFLTCIMLDIDNFKEINDKYGHAAGDKVIIALANVLKKSVRSSDLAARIGGEEFALILNDTSCTYGKDMAERIRKSLESITIKMDKHEIWFTASFGVAQLSEIELNTDDFLASADKALYTAKDKGRNCVEVSNNF
jgi:methyl-accepting chemotaxis protein